MGLITMLIRGLRMLLSTGGVFLALGMVTLAMPRPDEHLANGLQFSKLGKYEINRLSYPAIGSLLDPIVIGFHIAHRNRQKELAALRLLFHGFHRALAEDRYFHLAHRALHSQKQSIVGHPRIIDAVLIDDHRADESTEFEERVPITTIARQSGGLDRQNGANPAFTDRGEQLLEPGRTMPPPDRPRSSSIHVGSARSRAPKRPKSAHKILAETERDERRRQRRSRLLKLAADKRNQAVQAFWAMHLQMLNWNGMTLTHYAAAAKISKSSPRRWRDLIDHSKVEIDWRAQLHPSARAKKGSGVCSAAKDRSAETVLTASVPGDPPRDR